MLKPKTKEEIDILREGGGLLAQSLAVVEKNTRPGIKTKELDEIAEQEILRRGGKPSFKGYRAWGAKSDYPASLCVSINEEIVHGIPSQRKLQEGDLVSLDLGLEYKGLFTDMAKTIGVGKIDQEKQKLLEVCKKALDVGVASIKDGVHIGDIGHAIQSFVESQGFYVIRELVGHGVGYSVHEEPEIPNWGEKGAGAKLPEGLVVALEPMITPKQTGIVLEDDGWTWSTKNSLPAVHFEHTVVITRFGARAITKIL